LLGREVFPQRATAFPFGVRCHTPRVYQNGAARAAGCPVNAHLYSATYTNRRVKVY